MPVVERLFARIRPAFLAIHRAAGPAARAQMGDQVDVHLKFRAVQEHTTIAAVALVDLLPGGFELVIPTGSTESNACSFCSAGATTTNLSYADPREVVKP